MNDTAVFNRPMASLARFQRHAVSNASEDLVRTSFPDASASLPIILQPAVEGVRLAGWIAENRQRIDRLLLEHGAVLFRGFGLNDQLAFERILNALRLDSMHYMEGATPRTDLGNKVYTSTEFPPEHHIALHNELSYVMTWPKKICFFCLVEPETEGETPIADVSRVFRRIDPSIRKRFEEKGWMLMRNFGEGLGLTWQKAFRTTEKSELESYCRSARIETEWKDENRLRTRQVRPAMTRHPETGEMLWFNHIAFWHVSSLAPQVREVFVAQFGEWGLPYNTFYGDGSSIETSVIAEIRDAYDTETVAVPWQKGDFLLMDNMLAAHGRRPFSGARRILVAMGEPFTRTDM